MDKMILLGVAVLGLVSVGSAQLVQTGQCGTINLLQPFNANLFATDTWYEIGRTGVDPRQCSNQVWTTNAGVINVVNTAVVDNFLNTVTGTATQTANTAQFTLQLPAGSPGTDFWILNTDYDNWAIALNCVNNDATSRTINVWQLGRAVNSYQTPAILQAANNALGAISITVADLQTISHSTASCTQLPVIQPGQPIILPGTCNNANINVVTNFQVGDFTGTWHEISSYYSANAVGTCARANYELVGSTVNVVNSQVLNQQLDQITGTATLIGNDQSGRLSVVLDVQGVPITQELLIIATNYDGYAVSYSCVNLLNNQRQVNAWILSRSRTLSPADQTLVNQAIASLVDLNNAYFQTTDQSDAGCFYFPTAQPGMPVIFDGHCDTNVAAVSAFQLSQFVGTWHEIEAYPKEDQTGSCVNHAFSTGTTPTTLNLVSNQVVNQGATTTNGNVAIDTNDGTGRLLLTITSGGQTIQFPYWVLATDYDTYALVYSCVNRPDGTRAVQSWKLSKSQTLPAAANTPINNAMAAVQVLEQRYFETVDQTEAGCFYYPIFQPGVPVIFPGHCNPNVAVQPNFNPEDYMGVWHEIQAYPSTFQGGTCSNAQYTLSGGVVDVYNTQVVNQQLDTINGTAIIPDITQPAKLIVSFPIAGTDQLATSDYWVLATDYESYSLVYSCTNIPGATQRLVIAWKLSRTKALTPEANAAINTAMAAVEVLDNRYFGATDQTAAGCFYFPEAREGVPVVFPGQCENTIAAVPQFILQNFVGTWHEIEAYPKEQQTGTCVNHAFSAVPGNTLTLNLVSNQVVNQVTNAATGTVTLDSTDASGRLWLTLTTGGQVIEIPYWILATDYENYALAYSCVNINDDYRAVHSWKLSRSQALPPAAVTPINNAIAAVQVLDQRYFENVDQSQAGCLSYPVIPAGDPIILQGQCGPVTPVANFQSSAFIGTWHEIARYASARQTGNCAAKQFASGAANTFTLTQTIIYNERQTVVSGTATLAADGSGTMTATLSDGAQLTYTTTIHILDTDYENFALLYSCENVPGTNNRQIYSWQLSKSQEGLSQSANDRISQVIAANNDLFEGYYQSTGQTSNDCFYYPTHTETPDAIILPGTCPPVSGVASFNPVAYLNGWYDVGRYPIASQFGSCPTAEYTLVDGVITIRNTMVVNNTLRVQDGIGRLSNTGTGLIQATFVDENENESVAQYFILGTDYESYSLVYSCRNVGDGTRQVTSWKLSRTPTLTAAATAAINNIIQNTQGLLQEYYQEQTHTEQACFYVPEPVPGQAVVFRGGCGNVTGMQGFTPAQYQGWWHEIERYPTDESRGQCTSVDFRQGTTANTINAVEIGVYDNIANETVATAVINADASIVITRGGVQTRWVVLGTDYNNYSLLYSCEEFTTPWGVHRRVWSAKHSKARSLTAAANTAMNVLIQANAVLHPQLYEDVSQNDSVCFHYREAGNEEVILPGQCDHNIPVQANFDVSQFAGVWYQMERYPYPQVSNEGTCVGARYTVDNDGVAVQNWEVVDGVLNTIQGRATADGANLEVTLPAQSGEGTVTTVLQILLTDYQNYALAYTCTNINNFQRSIGAFKLSRSRSLSNEGQFAIQTYMATRQELHQPYFISVLHNNECQEPSSALLVKSSIIIMLVCVILQLVM